MIIKEILIIIFISVILCHGSSDSTNVKDPQLAWKIALVPGLGQIYNHQYLKSTIFFSAQGYSIYKINE